MEGEGVSLVLMAHFQEARLKELQNQIETTDSRDSDYFRATVENHAVPALIAGRRQDYQKEQILACKPFFDEDALKLWTGAIEIWHCQEELTRARIAAKETEDLRMQLQSLTNQNTALSQKLYSLSHGQT
jgi:hypothetical protein